MNVRRMCFVALMAALICAIAPVAVPVGPIPITLATFAVYLAGALLGAKDGTLAVALYLLLGAVGLPVFSGFSGGFSRIVGATGGYLVGYLPCAAMIGFASDRWGDRKWTIPLAMAAGTAACYALGTAWYMGFSGVNLGGAMVACVVPFLPGDALKIAAASAVAAALRGRMAALRRA